MFKSDHIYLAKSIERYKMVWKNLFRMQSARWSDCIYFNWFEAGSKSDSYFW